jgi:predicted O-methyltransferase YrrM
MKGKALFHFVKVIFGIEKPLTQTTTKERNALSVYCKNASIAVEIGVFEGVNTGIIAQNILKEGILYGIDPFFKGGLGISYEKLIARKQLKKTGTVKKVKLIEKLSFDSTGLVPDNIDFIFIDGDHTWNGIQKDWEDWTKKLRVGGVIALHDTSLCEAIPQNANLDSIQFFNKVIKNSGSFKLLGTVDSLNILQRIS